MKMLQYLMASLFALCLSNVLMAQDQNAKKLDRMLQEGIEDWKIPGMMAVVVKGQEVVFSQTYGVKDLETADPVDEQTLFNMGSTTKAIICMALGVLVDQGKLSWTDKVRMHYPEFRLSDPYLTEEARVQDLLTHNLGIGPADMLWFLDSVSTEETIARFGLREKMYPVRGGFMYNNLMYAIAGEVIGAVSGQHWTTFVTENILQPLEMNHTLTRASDLQAEDNYVTPYLDHDEKGVIKVSYNYSDQIGAAGMIWSCESDITNYLTFLVNDGVYKGDTVLSSATFDYLFKPHAFVTASSFYPTQTLTQPHWMTYGLGWFQQDYRGEKLDFHTGSIGGLIAIAGILRDQDVAVYMLANMDHAELRHAFMYKALDLYAFDDDSRDWHQEIFELYSGFKKQQAQAIQTQRQSRIKDTQSSLELAAYAGTYIHEMWGSISVTIQDDQLTLNVNDIFELQADHWHYDVFQTTQDNRFHTEISLNFNLDPAGKVTTLIFLGDTFVRQSDK